jgi:hypothetical protein
VVTLDNYALQSVSNPQFSWSTLDGNFQGLTSLANPIVTTEGTYTLTVTNQNNGCSSLADFTVPINENIHFDVQDIELPNIITFNGDSANYIWRPFLKSNAEEDIMPYLSEYRLQVFNRWGNRVFESTVSTPYWKPNDLSEGTYYYILEFLTYCGEGASTKTDGSITILR